MSPTRPEAAEAAVPPVDDPGRLEAQPNTSASSGNDNTDDNIHPLALATTLTNTNPGLAAIPAPNPTNPAPNSNTDTKAQSVDNANNNVNPNTNGNHTLNTFGPRPPQFRTTLQEITFVFQATIATATSSFLQGASTIITASIARDLGMSQGELTWITASTALTAGAFQLGLGQAADLLGRKPVFLVGMGSFAAFSLLVAWAKTPLWMDVVCGLLGVSGAMVVPPAIGIMGAAYSVPSKRKNMAFSAFSAGNPLGFVLGCVVSGVATMVVDWRASYVLIGILWAVFAVLAWWGVPGGVEAYGEGVGLKERVRMFVRTFDFGGTAMTVLGTGLVTAGITLGPADGWNSPHIIAMLVLGVALLAGFVYWETVFPYPLMPPHIWKDRNFTFIILSCMPGYMAFISSLFWLSLLMQELQHLSAIELAVQLMPQAIAGLIYNAIAGSVLHRINNTLLLLLGSSTYVGANVLLSLMRPESRYWDFVFPALVLSVVGADFHFNVANMYVMQSLPSHQQALAGGIFNTLFRLAAAIALGITTAVFSSVSATPAGIADPMLPYTRAFQVGIAMSGASFLFLPFVRIGTQGHAGNGDQTEGSSGDEKGSGNEKRTEDGNGNGNQSEGEKGQSSNSSGDEGEKEVKTGEVVAGEKGKE
ncbi:major facilitator superfamily-domain-containing protein [Chaetomium sp. MPI-SDFR-AT-0129]|nr:major facilitator superfamily-domain-containing protein [Chaetomium sp. MPI-SDFR-AT-0129]